MINYISIQNIMLVIFGAAVFVIVLTTIHRTLQKTMFQGRTALLLAFAVSALCIVGMYQFLGIPSDSFGGPETANKTNVTLNYILLPYVALAVAILLSQLLLFASKILPHEKSDVITKGTGPLAQKPKSNISKSKPGRPKKAESKSPPALQKPAGKGKNEVKMNTSAEGTKT
jgi:ABC-type uncharacterized transport system permease subunit